MLLICPSLIRMSKEFCEVSIAELRAGALAR